MEHLYYKPSGKIPINGLFISLISALILTIAFSMLYIALQWFIPFIYFNLFITIGLGLAVSVTLNLAIGWGKIRNTKYDVVLAVICGLLAWYAQWALFISLMYEAEGNMGGGTWVRSSFNIDGFWLVFTHPQLLFQSLVPLNEAGTFSLKHNTVTGTFLWIIWVIEAVLIIFIPVGLSFMGKATQPFSEHNNNWMEKRELEGKLRTIEDQDKFIAEISSGNLSLLKDFMPAEEPGNNYATIQLYESPGDPVKYITVENITHEVDKKGEMKKTNKTVVEYFRVSGVTF